MPSSSSSSTSTETSKDLVKVAFPNLPPTTTIKVKSTKSLFNLWAGMGKILEIKASLDTDTGTATQVVVIAKQITCRNPTTFGDLRKANSYNVEAEFYPVHAAALNKFAGFAIVPNPLAVVKSPQSKSNDCVITILMSPLPNPTLSRCRVNKEALSAVKSIATFHAYFKTTNFNLEGLQKQGSYWYLDTRPDEFTALSKKGLQGRLRLSARAVDERLKNDHNLACLHGDLKASNMCVNSEEYVSFCDFQYTGHGCVCKDLAYLFCCCIDEDSSGGSSVEDNESMLLGVYIEELRKRGVIEALLPELAELERALDLSYVDLYRWMAGWGVWGNDFLQERVEKILFRVDGGKMLADEEAYRCAIEESYPV